MGYILNTSNGELHTKSCADSKTSSPEVAAGNRQHFSNIDSAKKHKDYIKDHKDCLGN